jgi:hypothetical protein
MTAPTLGPIRWATLLAPSIAAVTDAYCAAFDLAAGQVAPLDAADAARLGLGDLGGTPTLWLHRRDGKPLLRLVEDRQAIDAGPPMFRNGWMALECLVDDADALVASLPQGFEVLGPPADLDVSPMIRASQVLGPCGELWYLTQVRAAVPPFDLPVSGRDPQGIFIGVVRCPNRETERSFWVKLGGFASWAFDTKITVLNRALGRPLEDRHPVAVVQIAGRSLVEIDEVHDLPATEIGSRPRGVWALAMNGAACDGPPTVSPAGARLEIVQPEAPG